MTPPPHRAWLRVGSDEVVGPIDRRLFGSFVEHLGRAVYGGIYEPRHTTADEHGFRGDVISLVQELGVTAVRYPGGNFVSGYRWEDGIGPPEHRPRRLDLAWHCTEPNIVGVDEFLGWCGRLGIEPVLAVNLGTRGVEEALSLLEYVNHPGGTYWSDLRAAHGHPEPYDVRTWCLGNEMDGPWQIGHVPADDYGRLAARTAAAMKAFDPDLQLVVCGSSSSSMPTFGAWERTVLRHAFDHVDAISCHAYYMQRPDDVAGFLASAVDMDGFLDTVVSIADEVAAERGSDRRLQVSFDEWNVWYQAAGPSPVPPDWPVAPAMQEDDFDGTDAVVVGSLLMSLLRHCDRVSVACLAQLVNVVAPIRTTDGAEAWRQPTFHPFALTARHARGSVLRGAVESSTLAAGRYGEVRAVDAVVTHDAARGDGALFALNRAPDRAAVLTVDLGDLGRLGVAECLVLRSDAAPAGVPVPDETCCRRDAAGSLHVEVPPASWLVASLA